MNWHIFCHFNGFDALNVYHCVYYSCISRVSHYFLTNFAPNMSHKILQISCDNRIKNPNIVWTFKKNIAEGWSILTKPKTMHEYILIYVQMYILRNELVGQPVHTINQKSVKNPDQLMWHLVIVGGFDLHKFTYNVKVSKSEHSSLESSPHFLTIYPKCNNLPPSFGRQKWSIVHISPFDINSSSIWAEEFHPS